jgi:HAD superfamily hydrolase (TIGR01484 family)
LTSHMILNKAPHMDDYTTVARPGLAPLAELSPEAARGVRAVLTDIDDTLTSAGRLTAAAYAALEDLHAAGLKVVPVTGRPAGWCDLVARFWPVDGVVGENGAFAFRYDHGAKTMRRRFFASDAELAVNRARLDALAEEILARVPGAALSADQAYRAADVAIDVAEDVAPLPPERVDEILRLCEAAGATAKLSSIHVNAWFGRYDKLAMARAFLADELGIAPGAQGDAVLFVGDSPNDEPMFAAFPLSVGVANIRRAAARLEHLPAFVTRAEAGAGFVELSRHLLDAREKPVASAAA